MACKQIEAQVQEVTHGVHHEEANARKDRVKEHPMSLQLQHRLAQTKNLLIFIQNDGLFQELSAGRTPVDLLVPEANVSPLNLLRTAVAIVDGNAQGASESQLGGARLKQIESKDAEWLHELALKGRQAQLIQSLLQALLHCLWHWPRHAMSTNG